MLGTSQTILLIEDEALIRMGTSAMLEDSGYRVLEAANADEAQILLIQNPDIAIVITDVQMPGSMDGLALADYVSEHHSHIPVLITSGRTEAQDALEHGAARYVPKPYTAATLEHALVETRRPKRRRQGVRSRPDPERLWAAAKVDLIRLVLHTGQRSVPVVISWFALRGAKPRYLKAAPAACGDQSDAIPHWAR